MQTVTNLSTIIDRYDALLLDLWGVVHDGSHLYPGVHDALVAIHKAGKRIIFVSNAPRRASKVISVLTSLGVEPAIYDHAISSGEVGYQWLAKNIPSPFGRGQGEGITGIKVNSPHPNPLPKGEGVKEGSLPKGGGVKEGSLPKGGGVKEGSLPKGEGIGRRYYYVGPSKDADILDGLSHQRVDDIKQADFLLNVGFGSEEQSADDFSMLFRAAKAQGTPMLCLNPDLEVVKQTGEHFPCAGVLAKNYERMGGKVQWFGKPYPDIYDECMRLLGGVEKKRILAVGDSLETDVPGALNYGIDAMLITGGILKKLSAADIESMCTDLKLSPHYVAPFLNW